MKLENLLALAISIAAKGFEKTLDKGGQPYMLHCFEVMSKMTTIRQKILAILHDTVEDNVITLQNLRNQGFPEDIVRDLDLLTHRKDEDYLRIYIPKISTSEDATKVKLADLEHNSELTRIKGLTKKDFDRVQKYHTAYTYLSKI